MKKRDVFQEEARVWKLYSVKCWYAFGLVKRSSQVCFLSKWTIGFLFYDNKGLCFHRNFQVLAALDSLMELHHWDFFRDSENYLICPGEGTSEIAESRQNPSQDGIP